MVSSEQYECNPVVDTEQSIQEFKDREANQRRVANSSYDLHFTLQCLFIVSLCLFLIFYYVSLWYPISSDWGPPTIIIINPNSSRIDAN